jgi:hypothetical protein
MFELARKAGSHHFLRRQQGEDGEKNDATPCEEAQRCCDKAGQIINFLSIGRSSFGGGIATLFTVMAFGAV